MNHTAKQNVKEPQHTTVGAEIQKTAKKAYRKPVLKRLGLLKSVAGSGIEFPDFS